MKISAFCLTTNAIKFQYPFIESIKSWLGVVDELIVIDGGSTDGTVEAIKQVGDPKIRIVQDEDTKWEDDWAYARMGHNFNRGYQECVGDIVIKFDIDYVLHQNAYESTPGPLNLRYQCQKALEDKNLIVSFVRQNFVLMDRFFVKREKTLATNKKLCKDKGIKVEYGLDLERWAWGYEPVVPEYRENNITFGQLVGSLGSKAHVDHTQVFNYGFAFCDEKTTEWIRSRHIMAEVRQKDMKYKRIVQPKPGFIMEHLKERPNIALRCHISDCRDYLTYKDHHLIGLGGHPKVMWDKIKNLTSEQQGYNLWGKAQKARYYL